MKRILVKIAYSIALALYDLFSFLPKHNRIVCISRQSNSAPVDFELVKACLAKQDQPMEAVILAKTLDRNKLAYSLHVAKQLLYIATSKAVLLDSYCIAIGLLHDKIQVPVIQMWHAMGNMKKFGFSAIGSSEGRTLDQAQLLGMHKGYDSILISSKSFIGDYSEGFGADPSVIYEAPLPKTDLLLSEEYKSCKRAEITRAFPRLKEKQNIVYCPTFRRNPAPNEKEAMQSLLDSIDFTKYNFVFKKHPVSSQRFSDSRVLEDYPDDFDMLYIADFVISDYSTVIYEAGLLGVPVFLYAYDWDTYQEKRSLNVDLQNDVPALFTNDPCAIAHAIEKNEFDRARYEEFILSHIRIPENGTCTQRVVDHIVSLCQAF